jgi:hypothetical protein
MSDWREIRSGSHGPFGSSVGRRRRSIVEIIRGDDGRSDNGKPPQQNQVQQSGGETQNQQRPTAPAPPPFQKG